MYLDLDLGILKSIPQDCKLVHFSAQFESYLFLKNSPDLHENFIVAASLNKKVPFKSCNSSGSRLRIWTGFALEEVCSLHTQNITIQYIEDGANYITDSDV